MYDINISSDLFFYLGLACLLYFRYISIAKNRTKINKINELVIIIFSIYIFKIISLVFFPIVFQIGANIVKKYPVIWLNPVDSWISIISSNNLYGVIYNIFGNLLLLFPLPTFLIYFYKHKVDTLIRMLIICFVVAFGIEFIQYIESILIAGVGRFIETNDVILNTTGGMLGYLFYNRYLRNLLNN